MTTPLPERTFDAVLFDLDGTLVNSVPAVERSWRTWAAEEGLSEAEAFAVPHGTPARTVVARLVAPDRVEPAVARITELELADDDGIVLLPGARQALDVLGPRCAIVTSSTDALAAQRFRASGLVPPEAVVTADGVTHGKPDPEPYLLGASLLGADPARCLVIEDAPAGLTAGRAAGCATLAVLGTHERDELDADLVVPDLSHVRFTVTHDGVRLEDARPAPPTT